jgi:exodeoxyribonuclease VII large subunit
MGIRVERVLSAKRHNLDRLRLQLEERSPLRVLSRGYSICYDAEGNVIHAAVQVDAGDAIRVQLAQGRLDAEVTNREGESS